MLRKLGKGSVSAWRHSVDNSFMKTFSGIAQCAESALGLSSETKGVVGALKAGKNGAHSRPWNGVLAPSHVNKRNTSVSRQERGFLCLASSTLSLNLKGPRDILGSDEDARLATKPKSPKAKKSKTGKLSLTKEQQTYQNLKDIPGVGPKNAQLFDSSGYKTVQALLQLYQDSCSLDPEQFRNILRDEVGIRQKRYRESITNYCSAQYSGELERHKRRYYATLSVEGNIAAGKSTFLKTIREFCPDLQDRLHVAPEPVAQWQNIGIDKFNLLEEFYQNKERFAYTFQNYVFITRLLQEQESANAMHGQPYRLLERSVWCDRMVFVESLKESKLLTELELSLYHAWFDPLIQQHPTLAPDGFIYLRAEPKTCMDRMKARDRTEEGGVSIDYLEDLHARHEKWLFDIHATAAKEVMQLDLSWKGRNMEDTRIKAATEISLKQFEPTIPETIKDCVKFLDKGNTSGYPSVIENLPALILDCNTDIRDNSAQQEHANKVNDYFKYVKDMRRHKHLVAKLRNTPIPGLHQAWMDLKTQNGFVMDPSSSADYFQRYLRVTEALQNMPFRRDMTETQMREAVSTSSQIQSLVLP